MLCAQRLMAIQLFDGGKMAEASSSAARRRLWQRAAIQAVHAAQAAAGAPGQRAAAFFQRMKAPG